MTTTPAISLVMAAGSVSSTLSSALFYTTDNLNFFSDAAGNVYWGPPPVFIYDPTGVLVRCIGMRVSTVTPSGDFIVRTNLAPLSILRINPNSEGQVPTNISTPYSVSSLAADNAFVYVATDNRTASDLFILKYALSTGELVMNVTITESVSYLKTDSLGNMYYLIFASGSYTVHKMFANGTLDTQFSALNIRVINSPRTGPSWFDVDTSGQSLYRWQNTSLAAIERVSLVDGSVIRAIPVPSIPRPISSSYQSITTARDGSDDVYFAHRDGYARFTRDGALVGGFDRSSVPRWTGSSVQIASNDRLVFTSGSSVRITANLSSDVVIDTPFTLSGASALLFVLDASNRGYFLTSTYNYTLGKYNYFLATSSSLQAGANMSTFALWSTAPGDLTTPISMAVDASGQNVFIADPSNSRIVRIAMSAPSNVLVFASVRDVRAITLSLRDPNVLFAVDYTNLMRFRVSDGALLSNVTLPGATRMSDVVVDPSGNAYVADGATNGAVYYVDASTGAVSVFASSVPSRLGPQSLQLESLALTADGACLVVRAKRYEVTRLLTYGSPTRCGTTPIAVLAWGDAPAPSSASSSSNSSVIAIAVAVPCGVLLALVVLAIAVKRRMQKRREGGGANEQSSTGHDEDPDMLTMEMSSTGRGRGRHGGSRL